MSTLRALYDALGSGKPQTRAPRDGRKVVATFSLENGERSRAAKIFECVAYKFGSPGFGLEVEMIDKPGYVTAHHKDTLEALMEDSKSSCEGWAYAPGSVALVTARGFDKRTKPGLTAALEAFLADQFGRSS